MASRLGAGALLHVAALPLLTAAHVQAQHDLEDQRRYVLNLRARVPVVAVTPRVKGRPVPHTTAGKTFRSATGTSWAHAVQAL